MARKSKKSKAQINKQLWDRANTSQRIRWQTLSQKAYDFYLNEQLSKNEKDGRWMKPKRKAKNWIVA